MNVSPIVDKTIYIATNDNSKIEVATLPKHTRYEVDTLDRLNQQKMDILCQLEVMDLAIHAQKLKLAELIKVEIAPTISTPQNLLEEPSND